MLPSAPPTFSMVAACRRDFLIRSVTIRPSTSVATRRERNGRTPGENGTIKVIGRVGSTPITGHVWPRQDPIRQGAVWISKARIAMQARNGATPIWYRARSSLAMIPAVRRPIGDDAFGDHIGCPVHLNVAAVR